METFYRKALEDLNTRHNGSYIFEEICHILVKTKFKDYRFTPPTGGKGNTDGGRDGFDANKKARMACSIQKDYHAKINDELEKINNENELLFFSNQVISEPDKIKHEKKCCIKLQILSLEDIVETIKTVTSLEDEIRIDSLLRLSVICFDFVKNKLCLQERKIYTVNNEIYTSKLIIENEKIILESKDPIGEYLISQFRTKEFSKLTHFCLKGQCGIGKTFLMNQAYNTVLKYTEENINFKMLPIFFDLKTFPDASFEIPNKKNIFLIFLDGLDEISEENKIALSHKIYATIQEYWNIRFIIAGRDGAFITEIENALESNQNLLLIPYSDTTDIKLATLLEKYIDSPIRDLLFIPLYRNYLIENKNKAFNSVEEFYKTFIDDQLKEDKEKFDEAKGISNRANKNSKINIESLTKNLQKLCCKLFCKSKLIFSKKELIEYFTDDEYLYLIQSSLFKYDDDSKISFISAFYFEYFTASFFKEKSFSDIKKTFFIKGGKEINIQYLNIFMLLLSILNRESKIYKKILIDLKKINPCYILLTDFNTLTAKDRYNHYITILGFYNKNKKHIYYTRFYPSADLLANISSLSNKMIELLPEAYYETACDLHINTINNFLKSPTEEELIRFANSIILLGVYAIKIWNIVQQEEIKKKTIPLLQFFINNPLAKKLSGLLSADTVLRWYVIYDWTKTWKLENWNNFFKEVNENFGALDNVITSKTEFSFKVKIYNTFHENVEMNVLIYPIIMYLLQKKNKESSDYDQKTFAVPDKLDDTYKTPIISFDDDLFYLKNNLEQNMFNKSTIIGIFSYIAENKIDTNQTIDMQYNNIIKILYQNLEKIVNEFDNFNFDATYKILLYLLNQSIFDAVTINSIHNINDNLKIKYIKRLCKDIKEREINYTFLMPKLFSKLLDIKAPKTAVTIFEELNCDDFIGIYKDVTYSIIHKQTHILATYVKNVYETSSVFAQERSAKALKEEKQKQVAINIEKMAAQEESIMLNKNKLLAEIERVFDFLDTNDYFYPDETERGRLLNLKSNWIQQEIDCDYKNCYTTPPVFSSFVIDLLFDISHNDKRINRSDLKNCIDNWFESEKYWRFIFHFYIKNSTHDEANNFINMHKFLYEKIKKTMKQEMSEFMKVCTISNWSKQEIRHPILTPFIYYLKSIYNNVCPEWFDKTNILTFCFIPCWYFSVSPRMRITTDFTCGEFSSVYDWLSKVFNCSKDDMLKYSLENINKIENDYLLAQCIDFMLGNIDNNKFKHRIEDLILSKTKNEILDYKKTQSSSTVNIVLSNFWRKCKTDQYVIKILENQVLDIAQINEKNNYCQQEIENYIIKYSSYKQKQILIKGLKKEIPHSNNILIFLARLGYKKAVGIEIKNYLKGKSVDEKIWTGFVLPFGFMKQSTLLLNNFISLFIYSVEKDNNRRQALYRLACSGIKAHLNKCNLFIFRIRIENLIKKLQYKNNYYEHIENFQKEMVQYVFSAKSRKEIDCT